MLSFSCPKGRKGLRAQESQAGLLVRCPACAKKLTVPESLPEDEPPEEEERDRPRPRKRKRRRLEHHKAVAEQGRVQIFDVMAAVLGMHLFGLIHLLLMPAPAELIARQLAETLQELSKELPPESGERWVPEDEDADPGPIRPTFSVRGKEGGLFWLVCGCCVEGLLLLCLYLRQHWARTVLAIWFLLGGFCGLTGTLCGTLGFGVLGFV